MLMKIHNYENMLFFFLLSSNSCEKHFLVLKKNVFIGDAIAEPAIDEPRHSSVTSSKVYLYSKN